MLRKIRFFVLFATIALSLYFSNSVANAATVLPDAVNDFYTVIPGQTFSLPAPGILRNDISRNGRPLTATATSLYSDPNGGTLLVNTDGSVTYSAASGKNDDVTFRYKVNDGINDSEYYASVTIRFGCKVDFDSNGGTGIMYQILGYSSKLNPPAVPTRSGYTFAGWYTDPTFTVPYDFNRPVTTYLILYANWTKQGSGGSGGLGGAGGGGNPVVPLTTGVPATAGLPEIPVSINATFGVNNGISAVFAAMYNPAAQSITARLDSAAAQDLIDMALWAKAAGQSAIATMQFGSVANASAFNVILPHKEFKKMVADKLTLQLNSSIGAITFGSTGLSSIDHSSSSGSISLGIKKLAKEGLSSSIQSKVKSSPVYRFELSVGNTPLSKISGSAKISVPYTLKSGEKVKTITVYYIDNKGALRSVKASYNSKTGMASFSLSRF